MPTGYTEPIASGKDITFPQFAPRCARAFGALIMMRDDPLDAPIPESVEPDSYRLEAIAVAERRLAEVEAWDEAEAGRLAAVAYEAAKQAIAELRATDAEQKQRYEAMLQRVRAWTPPTPDHEDLKKFMEQQLLESMGFGCDYTIEDPAVLTGAEYRAQQLQKARDNLLYHTEKHQTEVERARENTAWIVALRESLADAP